MSNTKKILSDVVERATAEGASYTSVMRLAPECIPCSSVDIRLILQLRSFPRRRERCPTLRNAC